LNYFIQDYFETSAEIISFVRIASKPACILKDLCIMTIDADKYCKNLQKSGNQPNHLQ